MIYKILIRYIFFLLDTEWVHNIIIKKGKYINVKKKIRIFLRYYTQVSSTILNQHLRGMPFKNPFGLAAGFDKNGAIIPTIEALGFGFTEIGSVTAKASLGNEKPRLFRKIRQRSIINRMGLNNIGVDEVIKNIPKKTSIPLGINIANTNSKDSPDSEALLKDIFYSYQKVVRFGDYICINISCPNTSKGKTLSEPKLLDKLLSMIKTYPQQTHILIKLSADLSYKQLEALVQVCENYDVTGYVCVNTKSIYYQGGQAGLSGPLIHDASNTMIRWLRTMLPHTVIVGVGGVNNLETALDKLAVGADILQIYTGLVYEGPFLIKRLKKQLITYMKKKNLNSMDELKQYLRNK